MKNYLLLIPIVLISSCICGEFLDDFESVRIEPMILGQWQLFEIMSTQPYDTVYLIETWTFEDDSIPSDGGGFVNFKTNTTNRRYSFKSDGCTTVFHNGIDEDFKLTFNGVYNNILSFYNYQNEGCTEITLKRILKDDSS